MDTRNNIDGIFPLTTHTEFINPKDDKWTKILVELVSNSKKEVSWLMSDWEKVGTIVVDILDKCRNCLSISSDKKSCNWNINKWPLTNNLPPYYICPDFQGQ
jgi:hypothetical protein